MFGVFFLHYLEGGGGWGVALVINIHEKGTDNLFDRERKSAKGVCECECETDSRCTRQRVWAVGIGRARASAIAIADMAYMIYVYNVLYVLRSTTRSKNSVYNLRMRRPLAERGFNLNHRRRRFIYIPHRTVKSYELKSTRANACNVYSIVYVRIKLIGWNVSYEYYMCYKNSSTQRQRHK